MIKSVVKQIIKEMLEMDTIDNTNDPINSSSPSIVSNPPLDIDNTNDSTTGSSLDKEQDPTDDAEQMSIAQIARAIEDTVETEDSEKETEQQGNNNQ